MRRNIVRCSGQSVPTQRAPRMRADRLVLLRGLLTSRPSHECSLKCKPLQHNAILANNYREKQDSSALHVLLDLPGRFDGRILHSRLLPSSLFQRPYQHTTPRQDAALRRHRPCRDLPFRPRTIRCFSGAARPQRDQQTDRHCKSAMPLGRSLLTRMSISSTPT